MPRFSLSPIQNHYDDDNDENDDEDSTNNVENDINGDNDNNDDDDDDDDYPHPLGFTSIGSTRFGLFEDMNYHDNLKNQQQQKIQRRPMNSTTRTNNIHKSSMGPFYTLRNSNQTKVLLSSQSYKTKYHYHNNNHKIVQNISNHVDSKSITQMGTTNTSTCTSNQTQQATINFYTNNQQSILDFNTYKQKILLQQQKQAYDILYIIKKHECEGNDILYKEEELKKQEIQEQLDYEEQERLKLEQEEKEMLERQERERKQKEEEKRLVEIENKKREMKLKQQLEQEEEEAKIHAKKYAHLIQAEELIQELIVYRSSLELFEKSKEATVKKRRLQMKKVARGKMNTLSHDKGKIEIVSNEMVHAIHQAKQEDEGLLQTNTLNHELALGQKYLIDLIASTIIVRIQSEGFNGTRGDGFPLAHALALSSVNLSQEFVNTIMAHIYTVCPTAIPKLPAPTSESDDEIHLMESLGMQKGKNGEYETFDRFLARTEGIISFMAAIMCSVPSEHTIFGGVKNCIIWLQRFLDLLPEDQSPLPLLTAPVLVAFLTAAGHMLTNLYLTEFQPLFDIISKDIINRLDTSALGQPSATRLKKLISGGISDLQINFPPGCIKEFYNCGNANTSTSVPSFSQPKFGTTAASSNNNPFISSNVSQTNNTSSHDTKPSPFGNSNATNLSSNPFANNSTERSSSNTQSGFSSNNMDTSIPNNNTISPFGNNIKQTSMGQTPFGTNTFSSSTPFGSKNGEEMASPSPFGGGNAQNSNFSNGFNTSAAMTNNTQTTPFGSTTTGQNVFNSSSFMSGVGNAQTANSAPFGSNTVSTNQSTFGNNNQSSFGTTNTNNAFNTTSFGSSNANANVNRSPFGTSNNNSTFGSSTNNVPQNTGTPFGSNFNNQSSSFNSTPFGMTTTTSTNSQSMTFGSASAFGNPTPFGTQATSGAPGSSSNPFGSSINNNQSTSFGQSLSNNNNNNNNKKAPPCKFFAQGRCRFGANCKFSHDPSVKQSVPSFGGNGGGFNSYRDNSNRW